LRQITERHCN